MKTVLIMSILSSFLVSCSSVKPSVNEEEKAYKSTTRKTYMQQLEERLVQKRANERKLAKQD